VLAIVARIFSQLLTSAEKSANETADNCRTERHPTGVMSAVMMVNFMMFMVVARCRMMVFLGRVMFWCRMVPYCLMSWGGFRRATFATVRSSHHGTAESYTSKGENHKFFKSLVHITPSLSFLFLMRTNLAAYNRVGMVRHIF
jgi:hypothetical protein